MSSFSRHDFETWCRGRGIDVNPALRVTQDNPRDPQSEGLGMEVTQELEAGEAVIIVARHKDDNAAPATEATRGGLPWESAHGRRSEWHVMRKEGRAPMIPWASSQGEKSVRLE